MSKQDRRRVVISGIGVVTPLGHEVSTLWRKLLAGESAVDCIERFDVSAYPTKIAAEIRGFRLSEQCDLPRLWDELEPVCQYAAAAAAKALDNSRLLESTFHADRVGVALVPGRGTYDHDEVFSSCAAAVSSTTDFNKSVFFKHLKTVQKPCYAERRTPATVPSRIAHHYGFKGPVMAAMTACATGTQAIGDGARWIRMNQADVVVAGASDSELFPMGLASFCLLKALSTRNSEPARASRPFDAARDGFVIGEGAGVLVLEEMEHALHRNARIYAEVVGFGSSSDAYRVTDPHPCGRGAVLAMHRALKDASVGITQVGYINAHGTSTPANDRVETLAIKEVFGDASRQIAISSTKSMIGHLTIGAGAVEAAVTALTLATQTLHPTINYEVPDPDCDLDYVPNQSRSACVEYALSNSFGFGGQCAVLVLRAFPS
jgi:3-oxoacyl-[acyl-carrier-protein] synthase II